MWHKCALAVDNNWFGLLQDAMSSVTISAIALLILHLSQVKRRLKAFSKANKSYDILSKIHMHFPWKQKNFQNGFSIFLKWNDHVQWGNWKILQMHWTSWDKMKWAHSKIDGQFCYKIQLNFQAWIQYLWKLLNCTGVKNLECSKYIYFYFKNPIKLCHKCGPNIDIFCHQKNKIEICCLSKLANLGKQIHAGD